MVLNIYIFIILIIVLPRISTLPFSTPRRFLIAMGLPLSMAMGYRWSAPGIIGELMIQALVVSAILSRRKDIANRYLILFAGAVSLGAAATPNVLDWLVYAAVVHSVVQLAQNLSGRYDLIDPLANGPGGLAGNTGHLGTYLVPHVFLSIHTGNLWAVPLIVSALVTSRCRGAFVGLATGMAVIKPWTVGLSLIGGMVWVLGDKRGPGSVIERLKKLRESNQHLSGRVLTVGVGGDVFRCLNDGGTYNYNRLHHDLAQALFDGGILASGFYLAAGLSTVWCAASSGSPWLAAAMVSLMTAGLFIHTQHIAITLLTFWVIVGQAGPSVFSAGPSVVGLVCAAVVVPCVWLTWGRELLSDFAFRRWQAEDDWRHLAAAYKLTPRSGPLNVVLSVLAFNKGQYRASLQHAMSAIKDFDGDAYLPTVYYTAGMSLAKLGNRPTAVRYLKKACEMVPGDDDYKSALEGLR